MAIHFASSEDIDFLRSPGVYVAATAGYFDANYARGTVGIYRNDEWAIAKWDTELSTMYLSWRVWFRWMRDPGADYAILTLMDDAGNPVFKIHPTNQIYYCYTWDGGWQNRATMSSVPLNSVLQRLTVKMIVGTSGGFEVWLADTLVASWVGDTKTDTGATGVTQAKFSSSNYNWYAMAISEVVVADEQTINMRVATVVPNADGTNTAWVNTYTAVDEASDSAADTLQSATANQVETMNVTNYGGSVDLIVRSVHVSARAARGSGGPQNLQLAVREGTTEDFEANHALEEVYATYKDQWDINPDTGLAWTLSELDTLEIGIKSIT